MEWRFRPMTDGEINVDPIEGELSTTEALDRVNHPTRAIGEVIDKHGGWPGAFSAAEDKR